MQRLRQISTTSRQAHTLDRRAYRNRLLLRLRHLLQIVLLTPIMVLLQTPAPILVLHQTSFTLPQGLCRPTDVEIALHPKSGLSLMTERLRQDQIIRISIINTILPRHSLEESLPVHLHHLKQLSPPKLRRCARGTINRLQGISIGLTPMKITS